MMTGSGAPPPQHLAAALPGDGSLVAQHILAEYKAACECPMARTCLLAGGRCSMSRPSYRCSECLWEQSSIATHAVVHRCYAYA